MSAENTRDITTISFGKAARLRMGMYLSADQNEALQLALREVYVNSLDALTETNQPKGNIKVIIDSKTRQITVEDDGPGIPNKKRDDGEWMCIAAYTRQHTGSHFDGKAVNSIGLNGVGGSVVNHTATVFSIVNADKKKKVAADFESNENGAQLQGVTSRDCSATEHGVKITYVPDPAIYGDAWFDREELNKEFTEMMKFYPKYKLSLYFDGIKTDFYFPKGLKDYNTKAYYESENLIIALGMGDDPIKPFCNRLYLPEGGNFFTHFKTQMTKIVNDLSGLKLQGAQVQKLFTGYVAIFVDDPMFSNQSKSKSASKVCNPEITIGLKKCLQEFSETDEWEKVIKSLELEMKAEEAAERARKKVKESLDKINKGTRKKSVVAEKLKDCIQSGEQAWLTLVEGDSALAGILAGRDVETIAAFPLKGKSVNCLKNSQEKFLENAELQQIFSILGCGIFENYNSKKLKYGNILIAVDADEDGKSILALLLTMFYVCAPQLLKEGRVWWLRTPLYYNADKHSYIFTEEDWNKVRSKTGYTRAKGLNEYTPQATKEALFGKYKRWEQLKVKSFSSLSKMIELLMGDEVEGRRDYIFRHVDFEKIKFL